MDFDKIYGHDRIKEILKNSAVSSKISHAYILEGDEGVGRMSLSLAFAKAILCEDSHDGVPCGKCKSCQMAEGGTHPDIRIVTNSLYEEGSTSKDILVGTIREMKKEIYIKPFYSERKIYIVPKAETINETAQNSLLKVFEEPPLYCTVILIAENTNAFLQTILSRAVNLKVNALSAETVEKYLEDNSLYPKEDRAIIAAMSEGSIGRAISYAKDNDAKAMRDDITSIIMGLTSSSGKALYEVIRGLKKYSNEADFMMKILTIWFRDCVYFKLSGDIVNADKRNQLEAFCKNISAEAAANLLDIAVRYSKYIKQRAKLSVALGCMIIECWEVLYDRDNWSKV